MAAAELDARSVAVLVALDVGSIRCPILADPAARAETGGGSGLRGFGQRAGQ
jgi:hypothetical protein